MPLVPGRSSTFGPDAPQSPSPPTMPAGAVALRQDTFWCMIAFLLSRRVPIDPPVYVGCGFNDIPNYPGHMGIDLYKTTSDVYVARSCPFQGTGVSGANVYPAFAGCSHQANLAKVIYAANAGSEIGNCVILEHTDNTHKVWLRTVYMHLDTIAVAPGDFVATTDSIGTVGYYTGTLAPPNAHLHFEILEQRAANDGWRTAAELALMTDGVVIPFRRNRPSINPETYLPPLEGSELLHIASPPPPASLPPLPSLELPSWRPYPHLPAVYNTGDPGTWEGAPSWGLSNDPLEVYPFLDAPDRRIYVILIADGIFAPATGKVIWLLHSGQHYRQMVTTLYFVGTVAGTITVHISAGQWITVGTKLATASGGGPGVVWTVLVKGAASALQWVEGEPFDLSETDPLAAYVDYAICPSFYMVGLPEGGGE